MNLESRHHYFFLEMVAMFILSGLLWLNTTSLGYVDEIIR